MRPPIAVPLGTAPGMAQTEVNTTSQCGPIAGNRPRPLQPAGRDPRTLPTTGCLRAVAVGLAQSGFNEVALLCEPLIVRPDFTAAFRIP